MQLQGRHAPPPFIRGSGEPTSGLCNSPGDDWSSDLVRGLSVYQCEWGCCGRSRPVSTYPHRPCRALSGPLSTSLSWWAVWPGSAVSLLIHCQCMPGSCKAGDSPHPTLPSGFCPKAMTHLSLRGAPAIQVNILPHTHTLGITQGPTSPMRIHTWTQKATCPASI